MRLRFYGRRKALVVAGALIFFLVGVAIVTASLTANNTQYKSTKAAIPVQYINFPQDHGAHPSVNAEWWYVNMTVKLAPYRNLPADEYSYVISFSRILGNQGLLASRYVKSNASFIEKTNTGGTLSAIVTSDQKMKVAYENTAYTRMNLEEVVPASNQYRKYRLSGNTKEIGALNLYLQDTKIGSSPEPGPLLWGGVTGYCNGRISVFAPNDTLYYSVPNLIVTGSVTDKNGVVRNVTSGKAWIDHQWFSSTPPSDWKGHYWGNTHTYSNEAFGFVTQVYGSGQRNGYWVRRTADGKNQCGNSLSVIPLEYGASGYPKKVKATLIGDSLNLVATLVASSDNQIFVPPVGPKFIETTSSVSGVINTVGFSGFGFFETHLKK